MSGGFTALGMPTGTTAGTVAAGDDPRILRPLLSGQWRLTIGSVTGTSVMTASVERAQIINLPIGTVLQTVAINVTASAASSSVRLGVRVDANGRPGTLAAEWGIIDSTSSGIKTIAINYTVPATRIWLTSVAQGGTPTLLTRSLGGCDVDGLTAAEMLTSGSTVLSVYQINVTGALPNAFTASGVVSSGTAIAVQAA